jgi:hypothetical protein
VRLFRVSVADIEVIGARFSAVPIGWSAILPFDECSPRNRADLPENE